MHAVMILSIEYPKLPSGGGQIEREKQKMERKCSTQNYEEVVEIGKIDKFCYWETDFTIQEEKMSRPV